MVADRSTDFLIIGAGFHYNMDQVTALALAEADKLISRYGFNS